MSRFLLLACALLAAPGCRKRASPSAPAPVTSASTQSVVPKRALTLEQLRTAHTELLAMEFRHESADKQLSEAAVLLGDPHERADGISSWFAWSPTESPGSPSGCWHLQVGPRSAGPAVSRIGLTVKSRCGR